jgi:plasmid stabilization system protein ParE
MRVRFTATANDENDRLLATIAADNLATAEHVASAIEATIARLRSFPHLGSETDVTGVRLTVVKRYAYLIFYVIENDDIVIRNIRHPAQRRPLLGQS